MTLWFLGACQAASRVFTSFSASQFSRPEWCQKSGPPNLSFERFRLLLSGIYRVPATLPKPEDAAVKSEGANAEASKIASLKM